MSNRPEIEASWISHFRAKGFMQAGGLASGMEGAVYILIPNELVAKVWSNRTEMELQGLKEFYGALSAHAGEIWTPRLLEIYSANGATVSIEKFLPGEPLQHHLADDAARADKPSVDAIIAVLRFLRSVSPDSALATLATLEGVPLWNGASKWSEAIGGLISSRLKKFGEQLRHQLPELDEIVAAVKAFLETRDGVRMSLIHGDLCGANVLVDDKLHPLSVIDFGFLTSVGDPAFDASISSAIYNMYGPRAHAIDNEVTTALTRDLQYELGEILPYRAVYSLITSNAYSPDGTDGHFRWCVAMLRRNDIRGSLGL